MLSVALVTLTQAGTDADYATSALRHARERIASFNSVSRLIAPDAPIATPEDLAGFCRQLKGKTPDALIIQSATLARGTHAMDLASMFDCPVLLWGTPEPPPREDRSPRSLSFVGLALNAANLTKLGRAYDYVYGSLDCEDTWQDIHAFFVGVSAAKTVRSARVGLMGYRTPGFSDLNFDELALRRHIGPEVVHVDLYEVVSKARTADPSKVREVVRQMESSHARFDPGMNEHLQLAARLYIGIRDTVNVHDLSVVALKCWPELPQLYGMMPCAVVSHLVSNGIITGCEADVMGALMMKACEVLTGEKPFFADWISVSTGSVGTFWHCGSAPKQLAYDACHVTLSRHCFRKTPLTSEFPLRDGKVTVVRLATASQGFRILALTGTAVQSSLDLKGNTVDVEFNVPIDQLVDTAIGEGIEHHWTVAYGDIVNPLCRMSRLLGLPFKSI